MSSSNPPRDSAAPPSNFLRQIIDDDMRIVVGSEATVYEKGVRRTVAVLRPITAESHAQSVVAVLSVLG